MTTELFTRDLLKTPTKRALYANRLPTRIHHSEGMSAPLARRDPTTGSPYKPLARPARLIAYDYRQNNPKERDMTPEETRNLELAHRYETFYNTDVHAFSTCYAEDCSVMGFIHGRAQLLAMEQRVCKAAPNRKLRVDHRHVFGSMLVMEAVLLDPDKGPDWQIPICIVATCRNGEIAIDRSYAEFSKWPLAPASAV